MIESGKVVSGTYHKEVNETLSGLNTIIDELGPMLSKPVLDKYDTILAGMIVSELAHIADELHEIDEDLKYKEGE